MGLVLLGTTTVHGRPKAFDAVTAARPAFPPEEEKKWILSGLEDCCRVERMKAPMPRDLKEPEGWRRSSLRKIHPAALERLADSTRGVLRQGLG